MTVEASSTRILVVDDEPNIAELLSAALSFEGYQVGVASTGAEALEQVRTFRPQPGDARRHAPRLRRQRGLPPAP